MYHSEWSGLRRLMAMKAASADLTYTEHSVTGNPAMFTTNAAKLLTGLTIPFTPVQASGTPSPDNPLPISGFDGVTITANGTDVVVDFSGTYYKGSLDAKTGVLTVDVGIVDLSTLGWADRGTASETHQFRASISGGKIPSSSQAGSGVGYCDTYNVVSKAYAAIADGEMVVNCWSMGSQYYGIVVRDDRYSDSQTFGANVSGRLVYELNEPLTFQLDPVSVRTIIGQNTISTNTNGSNTLTYLTMD